MYVVEIHVISFPFGPLWLLPGYDPHRVIVTRRFRWLWLARLYALPYRVPGRWPFGVLWPEIHRCH
jgi:hypothetical protein